MFGMLWFWLESSPFWNSEYWICWYSKVWLVPVLLLIYAALPSLRWGEAPLNTLSSVTEGVFWILQVFIGFFFVINNLSCSKTTWKWNHFQLFHVPCHIKRFQRNRIKTYRCFKDLNWYLILFPSKSYPYFFPFIFNLIHNRQVSIPVEKGNIYLTGKITLEGNIFFWVL